MRYAVVLIEDGLNNWELLNASVSSDFSNLPKNEAGTHCFFGFKGEIVPAVYAPYPVVSESEAVELLSDPDIAAKINYKRNIEESSPFAAKVLKNGKRLFSRVQGESYALLVGENSLIYTIPYPEVKFNEIEIVGAEVGDSCSLEVLDDANGSYSGIPNLSLNKFGDKVQLGKDFYCRKSNYDADLYLGMQIKVTYTSVSAKNVGINYILHEVK